MDAMQYLPQKYILNVLGYGLEQHMNRFKNRMNAINQKAGYEKRNIFSTVLVTSIVAVFSAIFLTIAHITKIAA